MPTYRRLTGLSDNTLITGLNSSPAWGTLVGTVSDQEDLQTILNNKSDTSHLHTGVYAPASHTHPSEAISATNIPSGYILSSDGAGGSIWEPITARATIEDGIYSPGYTFTRTSDTSITTSLDVDLTSLFSIGRRVKILDGAAFKYGIISNSVYGVGTIVTLTMEDAATIDANPGEVALTSSSTAWVPIADSSFSGTPINAITSGLIGATNWWIAVGNDGKIATSTDSGETWTQRTSGSTEHLVSVAYSPLHKAFLVGGMNGEILRTTDGTTWTSPGGLSAQAGTGDGKTFVSWIEADSKWYVGINITGTNHAGFYSDDGATIFWSVGEAFIFNTITGIAPYGRNLNQTQGIFTIGGDDIIQMEAYNDSGSANFVSNMIASSDCILHFVHAAQGINAILVGLGNGDIRIYDTSVSSGTQSTDDVTLSGSVRGAAWAESLKTMVVVGDGGSIAYGIFPTTTAVPDNFNVAANGFAPTDSINDVHFDDSVFVAVSTAGVICRSSNGIV